MHNSYVRSGGSGVERPLHLHAFGNTLDMPESDRSFSLVDRHLGEPPGGPIQGAQTLSHNEWPVRRHLDNAAAVRLPVAESHVPVVGQMSGPSLHLGGQLEHLFCRRVNELRIDLLHRKAERHRSELKRVRKISFHRRTGVQLAVTLNPRRRRVPGRRATAFSTVSASSVVVKPRITETTPSWRLTA